MRYRAADIPLLLAVVGMAMVGMTSLRLGPFTMADLLFLAAALLVGIQVLAGRVDNLAPLRARRSPPLLLVGLCVLTLGGLMATFVRSVDPISSGMILLRLWYITIVWFWTLRTIISDEVALRRLLLGVIIGAAINSIVGFQQELTGANEGQPNWGRSPGLADHFNGYSIAVASTLPILLAWRSDRMSEKVRLALVLVVLGGVGVSGSMTAMGSAFVGSAVTLAVPWLIAGSRRARRRLVPVVVGGVVVVGMSLTGVITLSVTERLTSYLSGDSTHITKSVDTRGELNRHALDSALESPIVGVGMDDTSSTYSPQGGDRGHLIHSAYLRLLYSAGILGTIGFLLILILATNQGVAAAKYLRRSSVDWVPAGLLGSLAVVTFNGFFGPGLYDRYLWAPFGLIGLVFGLCKIDAAGRRIFAEDAAGSAPSVRTPSSVR